jgi:hypothetical protein
LQPWWICEATGMIPAGMVHLAAARTTLGVQTLGTAWFSKPTATHATSHKVNLFYPRYFT